MIGDEVIGALRRKAAIRTRARALGEEILAGRYAGWRHDPLQERTVLYESFFGNGMLDNPEAIFRYLLDQPDMADLTHIWALDDLEGHPSVVAELMGHSSLEMVSKVYVHLADQHVHLKQAVEKISPATPARASSGPVRKRARPVNPKKPGPKPKG